VTLTHTISVFILGLVTLAFAKISSPRKLVTWLGVASGISIILIGATLFYKRLHTLNHARAHAHHHHHHHPHSHTHDHDHGPHTHTHVPEGEVTLKSLIALGASGGMVPVHPPWCCC